MNSTAPDNNKTRLFLAAPVDDALANELLNSLAASANALPPLDPITRENLHLTLLFLGQHPESAIEDRLIPAIHKALEDARPGRIHLRQVTGFPKADAARCLVVEGYPSETIKALQQRLQEQLDSTPQGAEAIWRPHITLARFRQTPDEAITAMPWLQDFPVGEVILYRSDPGANGPVYTAVKSWHLSLGSS